MRRFLIKFATAMATLLLLVEVGTVGLAHAADNGSWSVSPTTEAGAQPRPVFDYVLQPGLELTDSVTVTNQTAQELSFNIYAASAFNTENGTFSLRSRTEPKEGLAAWVDLEVDQITLAPGTSVDVPFTILVPVDGEPGDLAAGIVAENVETTTETVSDGVNVNVVQAVGTRIYARIEGPLSPSLAVANFDIEVDQGIGSVLGAGVDGRVTFTVVNTGNVRLSPTATLTVGSLLGSDTAFDPIELQELLPGGSATFVQPFDGRVPFGRIEARLDVVAEGASATAGTSTIVVPWLLILALVVVIGGFVLVRRRRHRTASPDETIEPVP